MQNTGYHLTYTTIVHQHFHPEASNKSIFRLNSLRIIPGICRFLHSHLAPPWRRERPRHMTLIATSPHNILQLIPKNANIAPWSHSNKKEKNMYRFSTLRSFHSFHLLTLPAFNNKAKSCSSTFNKHDGTKTCWTKLLEVWGMPSAVCHAATPKNCPIPIPHLQVVVKTSQYFFAHKSRTDHCFF